MNVTYTWVVTAFERMKSYNDLNNVVTRVLGDLVAEDSDSGMVAKQPFTIRLDSENVDPATFVSFEDINEALVLSWIQQTWGDQRILEEKEFLVGEIERSLNFEIVGPPWS